MVNETHPEEDYYPTLVAWLHGQGCRARSHVPLMSRVMDVVAVTESQEIWAFEVKLNDWRRGLRQAERYLLGVDRSYLVVPPKLASRVQASRFDLEAQGVGLVLLAYGGVPEFVLPAARSRYAVPDLRGHVLSLVTSEA